MSLCLLTKTILKNGCFCANILHDHQSEISDTFAGRLPAGNGDKFGCAEWTPMATGAPRVRDPLTAFDCRVISGERVGTHHVFIGEVREIFIAPSGNPLIFANRAYGTPLRLGAGPGHREAAGRISIGALHTFAPYLLPSLLRELVEECGPIDIEIHEGDQRLLQDKLTRGEVDLAFIYDIQLDAGFTTIPVTNLAPYVLLAESDPLAAKRELTLLEIAPDPMVLLDTPPSADYFLSLFEGVAEPVRTGRLRM